MRIVMILIAGLSALLAAAASAQDEDETAMIDVPPERREAMRAYMNEILEVAAEDIWNTDGFEGPDPDVAWEALRGRATALRTLGAGLKHASFAYEQTDIWTGFAQEVVDAADVTLHAAAVRDIDAFYEAGDVIYSSCESCHQYYAQVAPPPEVATRPRD